jgi:FixJ family two-component response regulator
MDTLLKSVPPAPLVCIVEDDEGVRIALKALLRSYGWRCETFGSAEEFMAAPAVARCACLVTDLHMQGMNGADLLEMLRTQGSRVPAIAITAIPKSALIDRALRCGISALLLKPFQDEALKSAVDAALSADDRSPPTAF